jgi:hypothetical protein
VKFVVGLIIVVGLSLGAWQIYQYLETSQEKTPLATAAAPAQITGDQLAGLPPSLEGALQTAEQNGATALREFLAAHGKAIQDPRRAWIELDYVVLVGANDPGEARRVFVKVKGRLAPGSPAYNRMQQLAKTYE